MLDAQRLDIRTTHALRNTNALTVEKNMHHTKKVQLLQEGI